MSDANVAAPAAAPSTPAPRSEVVGSTLAPTNSPDTGVDLFAKALARHEGRVPAKGAETPAKAKADAAQPTDTGKAIPTKDPVTGKFQKAEGAETVAAEAETENPAEKAGEESPEDQGDVAEEAEEGVELADTLEGLAEQLEMTPDELASHIKVKVGDKTVPLSEALKGASADVEGVKTKLAEDRKAFDAAVGQARETLKGKMDVADALLGYIQKQVGSEPDWDAVYREHGADVYTQTKLQWEKQTKGLNEALQAHAALKQQDKAERDSKAAEMRAKEAEKLLSKRAEWKDPAKRAEASAAIAEYAEKHLGMSSEEFNAISDHRAYLTLHDAAMYRASLKQQSATLRRVATIKPFMKAGAKAPRINPADKSRNDAIQRLRTNPRDQDAGVSLFEAKLQRLAGKR